MNSRDILLLFINLLLLLSFFDPLCVIDGLRVHDFELLLKTRFRYFFLLELTFKCSDVIKGYHAVTIHVFLTGLSKMVVIFLPE